MHYCVLTNTEHRCTYDGPIHPSEDELNGGRFWTMQDVREAMGKNILTPNFESEFHRCLVGKLTTLRLKEWFRDDDSLFRYNDGLLYKVSFFSLFLQKISMLSV